MHFKVFLRRASKLLIRLFFAASLIGGASLLISRLITGMAARNHVFTAEDAPQTSVAIVFGAGLLKDGTPAPVLKDRVEIAAELYFSGKVEKLLMSGDNRFVEYNEPAAMRAYAIQLGVPEKDIVLDYAGRRTYDTCYRARQIFGVRQAILVTQSFHLPRALYLCSSLGIQAAGVPASHRTYLRRYILFWNLRELPATLAALWEVHITHPLPVLGNPEPIFPPEGQQDESYGTF